MLAKVDGGRWRLSFRRFRIMVTMLCALIMNDLKSDRHSLRRSGAGSVSEIPRISSLETLLRF